MVLSSALSPSSRHRLVVTRIQTRAVHHSLVQRLQTQRVHHIKDIYIYIYIHTNPHPYTSLSYSDFWAGTLDLVIRSSWTLDLYVHHICILAKFGYGFIFLYFRFRYTLLFPIQMPLALVLMVSSSKKCFSSNLKMEWPIASSFCFFFFFPLESMHAFIWYVMLLQKCEFDPSGVVVAVAVVACGHLSACEWKSAIRKEWVRVC